MDDVSKRAGKIVEAVIEKLVLETSDSHVTGIRVTVNVDRRERMRASATAKVTAYIEEGDTNVDYVKDPDGWASN